MLPPWCSNLKPLYHHTTFKTTLYVTQKHQFSAPSLLHSFHCTLNVLVVYLPLVIHLSKLISLSPLQNTQKCSVLLDSCEHLSLFVLSPLFISSIHFQLYISRVSFISLTTSSVTHLWLSGSKALHIKNFTYLFLRYKFILNTTISITTQNTKFFMSKNIKFYLTTWTSFHF